MEIKNPQYRQLIDPCFGAPPLSMTSASPSLGAGRWCESGMTILPRHLQHGGVVHAGVQATIADHTSGAAATTVLAQGQYVLTAEFKINLLRPAVGKHCSAALRF